MGLAGPRSADQQQRTAPLSERLEALRVAAEHRQGLSLCPGERHIGVEGPVQEAERNPSAPDGPLEVCLSRSQQLGGELVDLDSPDSSQILSRDHPKHRDRCRFAATWGHARSAAAASLSVGGKYDRHADIRRGSAEFGIRDAPWTATAQIERSVGGRFRGKMHTAKHTYFYILVLMYIF